MAFREAITVSERPGHMSARPSWWFNCASVANSIAQVANNSASHSIGGFPDERRPARETERFPLRAADGRVDPDRRQNVQGTGGGSGDQLRPQGRVGEAVPGAHL